MRTFEKLDNFIQFTRIIADKFNINITFNENCTTDNTIVLPAIENLNDKTLDFMYSQLLKEIGTKVRSKRNLKSIITTLKTKSELKLALLIDDAKIERYLCNKFPGARKIFDEYWNIYTKDSTYFKAIFNTDSFTDIDIISYVLYENIIDRTLKWNDIFDEDKYMNAKRFVNSDEFQLILKKKELRRWDDIVKITPIIMKQFLLFFNQKDESDILLNNEKYKLIKDMEDKLNDLKPVAEKLETEKSKLNEEIKELKQKIEDSLTDEQWELLKDLQKELRSLKKEYSQYYQYFKNMNAKSKIANQQEKIDERLKNKQEKLENYNEKIENKTQKFNEKIEKLKSQIEELQAKIEKSKDEAKTQKYQDRIAEKLAIMEEYKNAKPYENSIENLKNEIEYLKNENHYKDELQRLDELNKEFLEKMKKNDIPVIDQDKLSEKFNDMRQIKSSIDALSSEFRELQKNIQEINEERADIQKEFMKKMSKELSSMQETADKNELSMKFLPSRENMEGWDAANDVQKEMDEQFTNELGISVINGRGWSPSNRNMVVEIDYNKNKIEDINPREIFNDVQHTSIENTLGNINDSESNDSTVVSTNKKSYRVWNKSYDKIINAEETNLELNIKLRTENLRTINETTNLFKKYFKLSHKIKYKGDKDEGQLDLRSLWKLACNHGDDFYEIDKKYEINNNSAIILVDVSGSMNTNDANDEKIQSLVYTLSQSLNNCRIPHEVLTYCAPINENLLNEKIPNEYARKSCSLETMVVKSFNEKTINKLASIKLRQAENACGESINIAIKRLRKRNSKNKILFLISDGKPYMYDSDYESLDSDLQNSVLNVKKDKITFIPINHNNIQIDIMKYIKYNTLTDLPKQLEGYLNVKKA